MLVIKGGLIMLLKKGAGVPKNGGEIRKIAPFTAFDKVTIDASSENALIGNKIKPELAKELIDFVMDQGKYLPVDAPPSATT